jgi:hypothetical protein
MKKYLTEYSCEDYEECDYEEYNPKSYVYINGEAVLCDDVEFLNIEEDISGRDLMTFRYQNKTLSSFIIVK